MPLILIKTIIYADQKTCFDLARDIDFHQKSLEHSKEKAIAGKTSGLIGLGESVTWEAIHFGIKQKLTSKITEFDTPIYFVDEQTKGIFKSFKHEHIFNKISDNETEMIDRFVFESTLGFLGVIVNNLFVTKYMENLLSIRAKLLKIEVEKVV